MLFARRPPRALPVRALLLAIVMIAALPTFIFSGFLVLQYAQSERASAEYELEQSAKGVARAIDAQFDVAEAALVALAGSVLLDNPDLGEFERRVRRSTAETGRYYALIEPSGQHVINTFLPPGATLPRVNPNPWGPVFAERRTLITDVMRGAGSSDLVAGIGVPVIRDGQVKWVIASRLSQKEFAPVLAAPGVPPDWIVSIVDRKGIHIARSHRGEDFIGRPLVAELIDHMKRGGSGILRTISLERIPLISTVAYAPRSQWATAIGLPVAALEGPFRTVLTKFVLVGLGILATALLLAFLVGRHLDTALFALSVAAQRMGEGQRITAPHSQVREVNAIASVLEQASQTLHAATANLESQVAARTTELSRTNVKLVDEMQKRSEVEAQVRQMQKIEAIGQLTGGIAHDFNNMLAIILGSLRLLQRRLERGETSVQKYIDAAVEGAERAVRLTSRLLAFSRQQPLSPEVIDVGRLVAGMGEILRRTIPENIEIETVLAGGLWRSHIDPQGLESVIINLAVNARDAMSGGGKLTIETGNTFLDETYCTAHAEVVPGQYVLVAVSDTGAGMSADIMTRAFDPFFTTKATGDGTGLGLSQVHGFVKQSGGHIKLYSEPGHGTSVKLYLPRYFGESAAAESAHVTPLAPLIMGNQETILVVEDETEVRSLTVEMVGEMGYVALEASGGAEALRMIEAHPGVRLVITDVVMPGMNGRQLADEIQKRRPDIQVLFTTGYTRNAIVHGGILDPGVHLVTKPHTIETLAAKIDQLLRARPSTYRSV